ncbi:MAG: Veg family protein [Coriobacteriales bacterium]|jgi:uncharacterized protein Veg|nr:Veg family protein [Coriobacteriales bacterium]
MDLAEKAQVVDRIRLKLIDCIGTRLKLRANLGRSRVIECEGTVLQAHPQLFIMNLERKRGHVARQSYQYVDILTGTVELSYIDSNESLFPIAVEA